MIALALKLTIRIIGRGDMVGIKLERGGGWKNFAKLTMWLLFSLSMFESIRDPLHDLAR